MKILSYPNTALTTKTNPWDFSVPDSESKLVALALEMGKILDSTPQGVALAANQVGLSHKLFVIKEKFADENNLPTLIVNPEFVGLLSGNNMEQEGCLSFPGMLINIRRLNSILVGYQTVTGEMKSVTLHDFPARMFQHEIEHLNGKTFLEQVPRIDRFRVMAEMKKRKANGL